ncbi:sensor histidine kinase [Paenibacillus sp. GCM10027626]|uniref:sensor histidine kinase n=1 Tax=Paenibacillus sp. GCM10027626 TaxID=3273411 RepID=UPI003634F243
MTVKPSIWTIDNWPIAMKLIVVYSLLISATVALTGYISYQIFNRSLEEQIHDYVPQLLNQTSLHLDNYQNELLTITKLALLPPHSASIAAVMSMEESENYLPRSVLLSDTLRQFHIEQKPYVSAIVLHMLHEGAYIQVAQSGGQWIRDADFHQQSWYSRVDPGNRGLLVYGTERNAMIKDNPFVFKVIQPLWSMSTDQFLGYIEVDGSLQMINDMLLNVNFGHDSKIIVLDQNNRIMYTQGYGEIGDDWQGDFGLDWEVAAASLQSKVEEIDGSEQLISYAKSTQTGWKVISVIPLENLQEGVRSVKWWNVLGAAAGILIAIVAAILLAYSMTKRLRLLVHGLRTLELNDFRMAFPPVRTDEVGLVWEALRRMSGRIHLLINEVYQVKILKQEAEIQALRSQVDPHFLNNSLETLRYLVKDGHVKKAEDGLIALGDLFRYHTSQPNEFVPLRSEMAFMKNYLYMQQLRFGDRLQVLYDVEEETMHVQLPALLFQPLVENAIIHGRDDEGNITLTIRILLPASEQLLISVIDEGRGIEPEDMEQLQAVLENERMASEHVGLRNVYRRLKLIYKDAGEMTITSEPYSGTIVTLSLPVQHDETEGS